MNFVMCETLLRKSLGLEMNEVNRKLSVGREMKDKEFKGSTKVKKNKLIEIKASLNTKIIKGLKRQMNAEKAGIKGEIERRTEMGKEKKKRQESKGKKSERITNDKMAGIKNNCGMRESELEPKGG